MQHSEENMASCRCSRNICYQEYDEDTNTADRTKKQRNQKEPIASQKQGEFSQCHKDRGVLSSPSLRSIPGSQERRRICMAPHWWAHALQSYEYCWCWRLASVLLTCSNPTKPIRSTAMNLWCHSTPQTRILPSSWPQKEKNSYCKNSKNWSFPGSSVGKKSTCNAGDSGSIPGSGRSPGGGIGYPCQYSWASLVDQMVKNPPAMWETWVQFGLGRSPRGGHCNPL